MAIQDRLGDVVDALGDLTADGASAEVEQAAYRWCADWLWKAYERDVIADGAVSASAAARLRTGTTGTVRPDRALGVLEPVPLRGVKLHEDFASDR